MALSGELRESRIKRLHDRFLEASEQYPTLYHIAVSPIDGHSWKWLEFDREIPFFHDDEEFERGQRNDRRLWQVLVRYSCHDRYSDDFFQFTDELHFGEREWIGRYLNPLRDHEDHENRDDIVLFEKLGHDAMAVFSGDDYPTRPHAGTNGLDFRWMEFVHGYPGVTCNTTEYHPQRDKVIRAELEFSDSDSGFLLSNTKTNVFLDSLRTIELLVESESDWSPPSLTAESSTARSVTLPTTTTLTAGSNSGHKANERSSPETIEPLEASEEHRSSYHDDDNYWRNVWMYKQRSEGKTNPKILADLLAIAAEKNWSPIETDNALNTAIRLIAEHHGWPRIKGKPGRPSRNSKKRARADTPKCDS